MNFSSIVFDSCVVCLSAETVEGDFLEDDLPDEALFLVDACLGIYKIFKIDNGI
jgi:hypothetical protein